MLIRTFASLLLIFALCSSASPLGADGAALIGADNSESISAPDASALPAHAGVVHARRVRAEAIAQRLSDACHFVTTSPRLLDTPQERTGARPRVTVLRI